MISIGLFTIFVLLAITAYSLNLLTPGIVVTTYIDGKPVNAYIQVFAVLPPGRNESLVQVWNGTAFNGVARVPITALLGIAREWVNAGLGGEGVGVEVVATYVNGSTIYYDMKFTTYKPSDLISTLNNPLMGMVKLNYENLQMNLTLTAKHSINIKSPQIPSPPAPIGCWWNLLWSWQTPQINIPITWVTDNVPNYLGGALSAYYNQQTTATVYFYAAVGITQGSSTSVTYRFIGYSSNAPAQNWQPLGFGLVQPSGGYIYQVGTLGVAELQLVCITGPTNQYAYEAFVSSIGQNGQLYISTDMSYINSFMSIYKALTGVNSRYVPFDEIYVGNGYAYSYWFSNVQAYNSPFGFTGTIPIGLLIALVASRLGVQLSIPGLILANLVTGLQVSTTQISIIQILVNQASSKPAYGDLLVAAIPVTYNNPSKSYFYYPYILGFNVTGLSNYSSGTSIYVEGPGVIFNPCIPMNSYNWTVYVQIGNSPLLVPGGTVTAIIYNSQGTAIWSGTFSIPTSFDGSPPHEPAVVSVPWTVFNYGVPYNTYYMEIIYNGYTTKYGSITYGTSTTTITIYAEFQTCG
ncbi:hypothetical protein [Vulcanisaeta sp. JCM 14467]